MTIQRRKLGDKKLVSADGFVGVEMSGTGALQVHGAHSLSLVVAQRLSETLVEVKRDDGLGQLVKVAAKNVGGIVDSVPSPVETFSITIWRIESNLELLDALLRTTQAEYPFDVGGYEKDQDGCGVTCSLYFLTFLLEEDAAFGDDYRHITVNVALTLVVEQ